MLKKTVTALVAGCLLASYAVCSGGKDGASRGADYVQGATDKEVKIGSTFVASGVWSIIGVPALAGLRAYLDMVNSKGGINGRQVVFVHIDDEGDPVKAKSTMQQLVEEEKVFATVCASSVTAAVLEDLKNWGIPSVYFPTGIRQLYAEHATTNAEGYNIFPVQPISYMEGQIIAARAVATLKAKKIGVLYFNDEGSNDIFNGVSKVAKELGVDVRGAEMSAADTDVSSYVAIIKNYNPDVIVCTGVGNGLAMVLKELISQGVYKPIITSYANCNNTIADLIYPDVGERFDVYATGWGATKNPPESVQAEYNEWISTYNPAYIENSYASAGWFAAYFFCEGLRRVGNEKLTWGSYMRHLQDDGPIISPWGIEIDYTNGQRKGVQKMALWRMNMKAENNAKWDLAGEYESINEMLSK